MIRACVLWLAACFRDIRRRRHSRERSAHAALWWLYQEELLTGPELSEIYSLVDAQEEAGEGEPFARAMKDFLWPRLVEFRARRRAFSGQLSAISPCRKDFTPRRKGAES